MPAVEHMGARIHYEIRGTGEPVLLLQGVGAPARAWEPQVADLARSYRTIAVENRGLGESVIHTPGERLTVDLLARDAVAVLDAEGIEAAHVMGHSLGGVIAQRLALEHRARVRSLALLNTLVGGHDVRWPGFRVVWLGALSRVGTAASRRRAFARLIMPDTYLAEVGDEVVIAQLEAVFGRSLLAMPAIADAQLAALRAHDERARLGELAGLPTFVATGEHDPIGRPSYGEALAAAIPGAVYRCWAGTSHALPIQCPAEVNAALLEHLAAA